MLAQILDCAKVTIGHRAMFAPNVHVLPPFPGLPELIRQIYAATHSTDVAERRLGLERAYPVTIGDDVGFPPSSSGLTISSAGLEGT